MRLTPRLEAIAGLVPECGTAADIGTDHAIVPVRLIETGRAKRVIASDVREGPLAAAGRTIAAAGMGDRIETRLGSGLSTLASGEAETVIIAGMGGLLIRDIIGADMEKARGARLVLQPMYQQAELREYLSQNGFAVTREILAAEGFRVYNLICAEAGEPREYKRALDYHIPPELYKDPEIGRLINKKKREFNKIAAGLKRAENADSERLKRVEILIEQINETAEELNL